MILTGLYVCSGLLNTLHAQEVLTELRDTAISSEPMFSLFLAGGLPLDRETPVLNTILRTAPSAHRGLVLLGDILSIDALTALSADMTDVGMLTEKIRQLDKRFDLFHVIPGQREWSVGKKTSPAAIRSLDDELKDIKKKGRLLSPSKGCGTPEVIRLGDHSILVLIDSQWAIESILRPGEKRSACELGNIQEWRAQLRDIIQAHPFDHILLATHHPIYVTGPVAGQYPLSHHLLPLPVIGTLITGVKSLVSSSQHFSHPAYDTYRKTFLSAIQGCRQCIVISGKEKSLQHHVVSDQHFFVAGSGFETRKNLKGKPGAFIFQSTGFVRADELENGTLRVTMMATDTDTLMQISKHEFILPGVREKNIPAQVHAAPTAYDDHVQMSASTRYGQKKFLRGDFYRKAWSEPISVPVMWLDSVYSGLRPVQLGGGNQTLSLRLENDAGEQYVIRSIDKNVSAVLPISLRGTFAENIVQDGIAASHPYGALVIPGLARAAGLYHTNPQVVYVPHQPALDIYDHEAGDGMYLLEERAGGNTRHFPNFGYTEKTISTADLIDLLASSSRHVVDQRAVLRARLFDIWLGDWDRHDDQWRWAVFEEEGRHVYRPIARDRDQVFFYNDGLLDYIASRPFFNPALRRFDDKIDHLGGLVWAAKYFDRSFLHMLDETDFIEVAGELQQALTDPVIDEAFEGWPKAIDRHDGARIRSSLRVRRNDLEAYARKYYALLARTIMLPATNDKDIITLDAQDDDHLHVTIDRVTGSGVHRFYTRTLMDAYTKELRIYALEKSDTIILKGSGRPSIRIRIIGGSGHDVVLNTSKRLKPWVYDREDGISLQGEPVIRRIHNRPFNNAYDRTDWDLNRSLHFPSPAYFTDEGFGISYNFMALRYGFRADPFKSHHLASLSYFFNTTGFIGRYAGSWKNVVGAYDFGLDAYITGPTFTQYYYGAGNVYVNFDEKIRYHIVKGSQVILSPRLQRSFGFGSAISITPSYQFINISDQHTTPRYIYSPASGLEQEDFGPRHYAGLAASYRFERLDHASSPTRGGEWTMSVKGRASVGEVHAQHMIGAVEGSLYIPLDPSSRVVVATHIMADKMYGSYEFFHALTLGGPDKLRGFRRDRFAGDARFLHATDLRYKLVDSKGMIPFGLGIYGSFDYGRVWDRAADSVRDGGWHTAWGGGIFIVPLGLTAFRAGVMTGRRDVQVNVGGALRF